MNDEPKWHVLHVRPRCEKKMAEYCVTQHVSHYLPLREETKVYQRRKVTVEKPVFPGYVFTVFNSEERMLVLKSHAVVRILEVLDQTRFVKELEQVRQALDVDPTLGACAAFEAGKRVRIGGGPFQGLEGIVQTVKGKTRVLLNVEMIGQAVAVEADMGLLEAME